MALSALDTNRARQTSYVSIATRTDTCRAHVEELQDAASAQAHTRPGIATARSRLNVQSALDNTAARTGNVCATLTTEGIWRRRRR